jgi:L-fucose isomerase-like protein
MACFTYEVVASLLHDAATIGALVAPVTSRLEESGGIAGDGSDPRMSHLYVVATGGTERALLARVEHRRSATDDEPVVLLSHGAHNSLPAALETLAALQQAGRTGRIVYLTGEDRDRAEVDRAVTDLDVVRRLHATRLGLVGGPSDWLVASSPPAEVVRSRWGPLIEVLSPERVVELARNAPARTAHAVAAQFTRRAPLDGMPPPRELAAAGAVGVALADVVDEARVDAVSVRCFDLLSDPGTSGCLALAALNDRGVVAGCEGDIPSTLAMLLVRYLLGQPSWMANPARIDGDANRVVLAHCTITPSMTDGIALSTHFESGIGVGIRGHLAEQPVTLVRIGGTDLDQRWIAQGRIVESGDDPCLCRTQATVELDDRDVGELLSHPLGNHLVVVSGRHRERLEQWWSFAIGT